MKAKLIPGQYIDNAWNPFESSIPTHLSFHLSFDPASFDATDLSVYPDVPIRRDREINASLNNYDVLVDHTIVWRDDRSSSRSYALLVTHTSTRRGCGVR